MYVRNFAGLGFDFSSIADTAGSLVSTGSKAVSAIKGSGGGGGNASQPKAAKGAKGAPAPQNWIESQSNTTLAIGGLALFALLLALES
jgi:hypothetical protein